MEQAYAQALWKVIEAGMDHKKAIRAMHESLQARGRSQLMNKIARAFARIAQRERQKSGIALTVAHEKDGARAKREVKSILEEHDADARSVEIAVDESIVGGWRLEGGGILVDRTFKKYLLDMYNRSIK